MNKLKRSAHFQDDSPIYQMWEERRGKNKDKWTKNKEGCLGLSQDSLAFQPFTSKMQPSQGAVLVDKLILQVQGPESCPCQRFRWLWAVSPALPSPARFGDELHNIAENRGPPQKTGTTVSVHRLSSHTYGPASAHNTSSESYSC